MLGSDLHELIYSLVKGGPKLFLTIKNMKVFVDVTE